MARKVPRPALPTVPTPRVVAGTRQPMCFTRRPWGCTADPFLRRMSPHALIREYGWTASTLVETIRRHMKDQDQRRPADPRRRSDGLGKENSRRNYRAAIIRKGWRLLYP